MEHDTEPEKSEDRELVEKQWRNHDIAPLHDGVMGGLYRVLGLKQLSAARRYTAQGKPTAVSRGLGTLCGLVLVIHLPLGGAFELAQALA